jgi:hypothetical protein
MAKLKIELLAVAKEASVASAIAHGDGQRTELVRYGQLNWRAEECLFSGSSPWLDWPEPYASSEVRQLSLEKDVNAWRPIVESCVYGEMVRRLGIHSRDADDADRIGDSAVEVHEFAEVKRGLAAIARLIGVVDVVEPAMIWAMHEHRADEAGRALSPLPPLGLLPSIADAALRLDDKLARLLALSIVHAIGQEAVLLAEGYGESRDAVDAQHQDRRQRWFEVLREWLEYLDARCSSTVPLKIVLPLINDDSRERWRGAWLPVSTIRAISFQIKTNLASKKRDDFISRIGMESPWDGGPVWGIKSKPAHDVVFCDPWPRPLDHVHWWQTCLNEIGMKLVEAALVPDVLRESVEKEFEVPWFRQSMAATIALAHSAGQFVGRSKLTKAASFGPEVGAAPNTLAPEEARLIGRPFVVDPGEMWKVGENPSLLEDERVSTPVGDGIIYVDPGQRLHEVTRNLAEDVKHAVARMEEFRRMRVEEVQLLTWWKELKRAVHADFVEAVYGHGWPWDFAVTPTLMLNEDYPPTARCKGGWLPWVIAMKARNQHLPPGYPVPSETELANIGVDQEFDEEALDVMITRAGTIPEQDPYRAARRPSAARSVRQLVLQGWHGKAKAQTRALQWLAVANPEPGKFFWYAYVTICASIALARWVHPKGSVPKVRQKLVDVLRFRQNEAGKYNDAHARALEVWLDAFLASMQPCPV